jgi:WD40 repeat protein
MKNVCCFCFSGTSIYTGYEDGLLCSWDGETGEILFPFIGHTNKINCIAAYDSAPDHIYTASNDCTVRQWNVKTGACEAVFKFADPVSVVRVQPESKLMFTASWDKMVRIVDLEANRVTKSFVASKEAIKAMIVTDKHIFVAGCDPIIRGFSLETGECKMYQGHEGWIYCLEVFEGKLFSGGDDRTIKIWDIETTQMLEELNAHENGVTCLAFANHELFSGSYDHYIICWDMQDIETRIHERAMMREEDIRSRKIEVFNRIIEAKRGKKKKGKGAKKGKK